MILPSFSSAETHIPRGGKAVTMSALLAGRIAFITGGASGLGRATALRLSRAGARVVVLDLPAAAAAAGAALAAELGGSARALSLPGDVTSESDITSALDAVVAAWGAAPDIAVSCAGIATPGRVLGKNGPLSLDVFSRVLAVNVTGTFNVARLCASRMAARTPVSPNGERGVIVNTASVAAFEGQIGQSAYAASKGAIASLTLPMARDLARSGVRVCAVAPGLFLTPLLEGLPPKVQGELAADVPFPTRLGIPDEFAALVEHIVLNPYMNGTVVRLDGALRMKP